MTDAETGDRLPTELPVVAALRGLSVFTADQAGAYREHFAALAAALGADVETKLGSFLARWATSSEPGTVVLTGNAGTGKTAAAEAYCRSAGALLPNEDALVEIAGGRRVLKDLSGMSSPAARAEAVRDALSDSGGQTLVCANEGVLRDALDELGDKGAAAALDEALRHGAASARTLTIVNVNRQRPTGEALWTQLIDYLTRAELWSGCADCPYDAGGCTMRSNAELLRRPDVREQLRTLFRLGTGEAVPTLREVLAILSWAIVGRDSCSRVKNRHRDLGPNASTAVDGYFARVLGGGMSADAAERSPLLAGIRRAGLGEVSDLQVDGWLRDTNGAPESVRTVAGDPDAPGAPDTGNRTGGLAASRSPLDRVQTKQNVMTFHALGEMVSTDEDVTRVEDGLEALVQGDGVGNAPAQTLWRQRVYFEASADLGGAGGATRRLLHFRYISDLVELAGKASLTRDTILELNELVRGLNYLVTGFASPNEGLIVPDPACLFARDPGAFRPARPSLVHSLVSVSRLSIRVPDRGLVEDLLDVDHVDVDLLVDETPDLALRIQPRMYEAIREAAEFGGPVGQGVAEMNDLRGFYGRLATHFAREVGDEAGLRLADPESRPPALVKITLPHFTGR